jgi:hypothetical protein
MKITLCGSINFAEEILRIRDKLADAGHEVFLPQSILDLGVKNMSDAEKLKSDRVKYISDIKPHYTRNHFELIKKSDAILVVNIDKKGISNYIGGATFSEIMMAFHYNKKIFLLNPIPTDKRLEFIVDELESAGPTILNGDLNKLS